MKVRTVMGTRIQMVSPKTTYEEAAKIMDQYKISGLPVVEKNGTLVGMISEKDLFRALYPRYEYYAADPEAYRDREAQENEIETIRKNPVELYMSRNVLTIEPDAPILKAGGLMLARGFHRLPVVDNGKLVGIVTREDIYGAVLKHHLGY